MIEKITAYKTDDGELLESRESAQKLNRQYLRKQQIELFVKEHLFNETVINETGFSFPAIPVFSLSWFLEEHGEFLEAINKFMQRESDPGIAGLLEWKE